MKPYDNTRGIEICRRALQQRHLTREKSCWSFGRRRFPFVIVRALIDAGEAVCVGEHLVARRPPQ